MSENLAWVYAIAFKMFQEVDLPGLGNDRLPGSLVRRLEGVNKLCEMTGGTLRSRQVIAHIVAQWIGDYSAKYHAQAALPADGGEDE